MMPGLASLDNRYLVLVGWTLFMILWETTVVAVLLVGWRVWRSRASAERQHDAAVVAMIAAVVIAAATPGILAALPVSASPSATSMAVARHISPEPPRADEPRAFMVGGESTSRGTSAVLDHVAAAAAVAWALGVLIFGGRLLGGWVLARAIARRAEHLANDSVNTTALRLIEELRLGLDIRVVQSPEVDAPAVIGWRRPTLILPPEAGSLSPDMIAALLAHEFAHIRRRDYVANLVQSSIEVFLFFSPAVVWISRRIREAREFCCDDIAVARCKDARHYVHALTTLAALGTMNTARPALGAAGPRLITRVRRLLQGEAMPTFSSVRLVALAAALIVLVAAGSRVSLASAARVPRAAPAAGAPRQDKIPFGYATEQHGSGVVLEKVISSAEAPAQRATVRNISSERIIGLRFVAAVERFGATPRSVRLFTSDVIPASIASGQSLDVSPNVLSAAQVQDVAAETPEGHLQFFIGLQSVQFANGYLWSMTPNPAALTGEDALNLQHPIYSRDLITRDARRPQVPNAACRDEQNAATSHGGVVSILNEPGRFMRCDNGRWIETALK